MDTSEDLRTLQEVGERVAVREITHTLQPSPLLLDGFGHDAGFVDISLSADEVLVVNSDRSGLNIAYTLGLAGPECVGDFGVSHAVSDVIAAGGNPKVVAVALLLPPDTQIGFLRRVMVGAERAAARYGAVLSGGDTKQNPKFAMVVTAIGTAHRDNRLCRSTAQVGDALVVTGHLGSMLLGTIMHRKKLDVPDAARHVLDNALIHQHPPFLLGRALADARVARACVDISDGLAGALYSLCSASGVGALVDEGSLPINPVLHSLVAAVGIRPMQLSCGGGDWQYLYSIPPESLGRAFDIASRVGTPISIIGRVIGPEAIMARALEGDYRYLNRLEHDSFSSGSQGVGYFRSLETGQHCFGGAVDASLLQAVEG
jgi:thiamine-monophosphate kinase